MGPSVTAWIRSVDGLARRALLARMVGAGITSRQRVCLMRHYQKARSRRLCEIIWGCPDFGRATQHEDGSVEWLPPFPDAQPQRGNIYVVGLGREQFNGGPFNVELFRALNPDWEPRAEDPAMLVYDEELTPTQYARLIATHKPHPAQLAMLAHPRPYKPWCGGNPALVARERAKRRSR